MNGEQQSRVRGRPRSLPSALRRGTGRRPTPWPLLPLLLAFSLLLWGCGQPSAPLGPTTASAPRLPDIFVDVTAQSGIDFVYHNGEEADNYTMIETLGGGIALFDYDGDGKLDIFITGGGHFGPNQEIIGNPCKLYHNEGNLRFRDVTAEMGLDRIPFYTHGVAIGDYDNDGWPDLLVTGYGRMALFRNMGGKRFEEVTAQAGLLADDGEQHWSTSAAFGDLNGDGYLDLYVCHYGDWSFANHPFCRPPQVGPPREICPPTHFLPLPHRLYLNNGNGTFREVSKDAGLRREKKISGGRGLGVVFADFDADGKLDIYVTNDEADNWLYLNKSALSGRVVSGEPPTDHSPLTTHHPPIRLDEVGIARGVSGNEFGKADGSMGVDCGDLDGSGRLSIFVTNFVQEVHALYRNEGNGQFRHQSGPAGIKALGMNFSGWGTSFIDWDLTGVENLIFVAGHPNRHPLPPLTVAQRAVLLKSTRTPGQVGGKVRFDDVSSQGGPYFQAVHRGRGLAVGDLDNDGKPDLVISHVNEPLVILRNQLETGHHWLGVELIGKPNRDAVGAKATLEFGGQRLIRVVKGGGSYLSSSDRRLLFGLGKAKSADKLTVRWPSGREQTWLNLPIDKYVRLVEGE